MPTIRLLLVCSLLLHLLPLASASNRVLELKDGQGKYSLPPYIHYCKVPPTQSPGSVLTDTGCFTKFIPNSGDQINLGTSDQAVWFRFDLINLSTEQEWYLTVDFPPLNNISLYLVDSIGNITKISHKRPGLSPNSVFRDNSSYVFHFHLKDSARYTVFIRVHTSSFLLLPATMMSSDTWLHRTMQRFSYMFIIFGIILATFLLNFVLFLSTREKPYLLMLAIILLLLFISYYQYGFGFEFFPNLPPYLHPRMRILLFAAVSVLLNLFTVRFLHLEKIRRIKQFYRVFNAILLIFGILALFPTFPARWLNFTSPVLSTIVFLVGFILGIMAILKKQKMAVYYTLGVFSLILSSVILMLVLYGVIPFHPLLHQSNIFGSTLFCLMLTLGLRGKIRILREDQRKLQFTQEMNEKLQSEILERTKTEKELKESRDKLYNEQLLTRLLSSAVISTASTIVITDVNGVINYVNPAFTDITGYEPHEAIGKNPSVLKGNTHTTEFYADLWNTILSGNTWKGEFYNRKKNGELYWESALITPVMDEKNKQITHFVAVKEDITATKRIMEDLEKSELRLRELNASKDKLFSIIGHDLINPFNALLGFSQILHENLDKKADPDNTEFARIINESARHVTDLLQNLLVWAGRHTGKILFNPSLSSIPQLLAEVVSYVQPTVKQKEIVLTYDDGSVTEAYLDYDMIATVLRNLLWNAMKFSSQGGSIHLKITMQEHQLVWSVADTGTGMDHEKLNSLFQVQSSYNAKQSTVETGTGLGLIICKELIDAHNGRIWAESEPGKGSTFFFTLPQ